MWKLIRGIIWTVLSISLSIWSYVSDNGWLQLLIFSGCILLSLSVTRDGWKEYKVETIKNK